MDLPWPQVSLGEHIDLLTGFPFKSKFFTDDPQDLPLVKGENVQQGYIDWDVSKRWPRDNAKAYERYRLKVGDVVLAMDRPWIEAGLKFAWIKKHDPECLLVQRTARLRGDESLITEYLRYLIASPAFTAYVRPIVTGVNVPHISPQQIRDFKFRLPPIDLQRKSVAILLPFDDLIENNRRRIRILEEIVKTIFTEWFVRFRFPGHESVRFVDSPLGRIPEDWHVVGIGAAFTTVLGGTPSRSRPEYWKDGTIPWINSSKVNESRVIDEAEFITQLGLDNSSAKIMPRRTTLIAITGATLGQVSLLEIEAAANQSVVGVYDGKGIYSEYAFLTVRENIQRIINRASGGAQQHINKEIVNESQLVLPLPEIIDSFNRLVRPMFDSIRNLLCSNQVLRMFRDTLLPKLISGELDVSDLDIKVENGNT